MSSPAERRIGEVIAGKWRVDSLLGSGSMASVYSVTHRNGARAALKILHPSLSADASVCERFLGEGYLTNSVKHSGICRVLDDGVTDDGCVFLVMDLLEGRTLEVYRDDCGGQIPLHDLLDIADKLMDVLHAVHEAGIVHRDLKLQNVFVCNDGSVKLLDFGVARLFDPTNQSKHTMFGMVLGTPSFMSPEQALGARDKVDHRSDIWSLGATLFTSLTGQTVHLGPHLQAKLLAAATVQARSIALVRQDLPASIAAAIDRALRFERDERWQSVDAFRRAFRDARRELGLAKPQTVPPPNWLDDAEGLGAGPAEDDAGTEETIIAGPGLDTRSEPTTLPHVRASIPDDGAAALPVWHKPAVRTPMESRPEGSFPGTGASVPTGTSSAEGASRSSLTTWVAGAIIAGAITGGAGFYVLRSAPPTTTKNAGSAAVPPTTTQPVMSAPALQPRPAPAAVTVAMPEVDAKEARDPGRDASVAVAPSPTGNKDAPLPRAPKVKASDAPPAAAPPQPVTPEPPPAAPAPAPAPKPSAQPLDPFDTPN